MKSANLFYSVFISFLILSCFKEDEKVIPFAGEITTITDSIQAYQSYFNFESGTTVNVHPSDIWHLGFECSADGWRIITNSGANWFIYNTEQSQSMVIEFPHDLRGLYDIQHAWPDSTAVGNWVVTPEGPNTYTKNIYLLGKYTNGAFDQIKQITFLEVSDSIYKFHYKETESATEDTVTIYKKENLNFVYYSFQNKDQTEPEPDKNSYDIIFCSYYDLATLFGQTIPYLVGGVLLNKWQTSVAIDTVHKYQDISIDDIANVEFISQPDIPGYQWKTVTVDITGGGAATYDVKTQYNYIVKTAQENYFKMRFVSYTLDGRSGFPRFEFSRLQ
jgi:hypothetical protein